jgi:hypothetical protein
VSQPQPTFPTTRAVVVQLRTHTPGAPARYDDRVEHLVSGQVGRFHSLEELLAFMSRVLTDVQQRADAPCARRSGPQQGVARLLLVLDRRCRLGEGRAAGVPWGAGRGKGGWESWGEEAKR